jgi:divalent metal cation (Fe/Co/Zn/Cd) transporter
MQHADAVADNAKTGDG